MSNTPQQTIKYPELKVLVGQFFKYALSQYKLFLIVCTVTAALGLVYGKLQPHTYKATSTFIVEDKSGSRGGGLSGLASAGIGVAANIGGTVIKNRTKERITCTRRIILSIFVEV